MTESSAAEKEKRAAAAAAKLEEDRRAAEAARLQRAEQQQRTLEMQRRAAEEVSGTLSCSGIPGDSCTCHSRRQDLQCRGAGTLLCDIAPNDAVPARGAHRACNAGSAGGKDLPCAVGRADTKRTCRDTGRQAHMTLMH